MANMSQSDRNAFERASIGSETLNRPRDGSTRGITITFLVLVVILALLTWALIATIDGWAHLIVLGDLVILTAALAFFVRSRTKVDEPAAGAGEEGWRPKKF